MTTVVRHFKNGRCYEVVDTALDTVTGSEVVIYKPLYACEHKLFTRPAEEFHKVFPGGVARFAELPPAEATRERARFYGWAVGGTVNGKKAVIDGPRIEANAIRAGVVNVIVEARHIADARIAAVASRAG